MIHRLVTVYSAWQQRSRRRALHFHAGPRGAYACTAHLCNGWPITGEDAARLGFE